MSEQPATAEEARRVHAATAARLNAMGPEPMTADQVVKWLASIEGRPVRVSAPGFCALPAPLEASGVLSSPVEEEHADFGTVRRYGLTPTGSFFIAPAAITSAAREYVNGDPIVDIAMRIEFPLTTYRLRITATLAELSIDA